MVIDLDGARPGGEPVGRAAGGAGEAREGHHLLDCGNLFLDCTSRGYVRHRRGLGRRWGGWREHKCRFLDRTWRGGWRRGAYASSTLSVTPGQTVKRCCSGAALAFPARRATMAILPMSGRTGIPQMRRFLRLAVQAARGTHRAEHCRRYGWDSRETIGTIKVAGANGANGATGTGISSGAGGAGAQGGGAGGPAVASGTSAGNPGTLPGGGGGGARTSQSGGSQTGGAGATGEVAITWTWRTFTSVQLRQLEQCCDLGSRQCSDLDRRRRHCQRHNRYNGCQ